MDPDEGAYIFLGRLAVTGQISLFQDELTGQRVPLPYYVFGISQVLFGRSLLAARLTSAGLGLVCLILVYLIGRRVAGETCGTLALLIAATQSLVIGYFAAAYYHSLVSLLLLGGTYLAFCTRLPHHRLFAMSCFSLIFLARANIVPVIVLAAAWLAWESEDLAERLLISMITILPPALFFLSDLNHLKLLAYAPVVRTIVLPLGFVAVPPPHAPVAERTVLAGLMLFGRWYKTWILAALFLVMLSLGSSFRRRLATAWTRTPAISFLTIACVYLTGWQLVIFSSSVPLAVGYLPSFALLWAICLGWAFSTALATDSRARRMLVGGFFISLVLLSPSLSRPPALPLAVGLDSAAMPGLARVAGDLRQLIPENSKVFLFGPSQPLYLAGLTPYLRQVTHYLTISSIDDDRVREKSGLWGAREIRDWLTEDADYAVVVPEYAASVRSAGEVENIDLMRELLDRYFQRRATLDQYPGIRFEVYERRR